MRIAAWALTLVSALTCAWLVAVAAIWLRPGGVLHDPYYAAAAARSVLLLPFLALLNGAGTLALYRKQRPGALWIVLGAGVLAVVAAAWHYLASQPDFGRRIPDYADAAAIAEQGRAVLRWLLAWAALGFSVVGWGAWAVHRRSGIGHGRD